MNKNNSQEHWDRIWGLEGKQTWRIYPRTFQAICNIIGKKQNVLELGCGVGILAKKIQNQENYVVGIDISVEAIKHLHDQGIDGVAYDVPPLPLSVFDHVRHYDFVVASEFLEHFEDPTEILSEMANCATNAIIVVPDNVLSHEECDEHFQKFNKDTLRNILLMFWQDVSVKPFVEEFDTGSVHIRLPTLMALCRGAK